MASTDLKALISPPPPSLTELQQGTRPALALSQVAAVKIEGLEGQLVLRVSPSRHRQADLHARYRVSPSRHRLERFRASVQVEAARVGTGPSQDHAQAPKIGPLRPIGEHAQVDFQAHVLVGSPDHARVELPAQEPIGHLEAAASPGRALAVRHRAASLRGVQLRLHHLRPREDLRAGVDPRRGSPRGARRRISKS